MDTSDTSSVLCAIVQNDRLIYEKACTMKGDPYSPNCHSITLKIQNRGLGFFDWYKKWRTEVHMFQKRMWMLAGGQAQVLKCMWSKILTTVSLLTVGTQELGKEWKKIWKSSWNAVAHNLPLHISSNTNKIRLVRYFPSVFNITLKNIIFFPLH